jgi:hypothetical protein
MMSTITNSQNNSIKISESPPINFQKSPLRISTMTVTADWGTQINLNMLFQQLHTILIPMWYPSEGILKFEHKNVVIGSSHRDLFTNRKVTKHIFYNQATMVVRRHDNTDDDIGFKEVNIKLFANGGLQMTGITSEDFARDTIEWLHREFQKLPESVFNETVNIGKFSVHLINTDYTINYNVQQENLHRILCKKYQLFSMLDKTIYQGINTKYFYNTTNTTPGICGCAKPCEGKGLGDGYGRCKKITICIFRTGKIIITGARNMKQIETAYDFLNNIFQTHASEVLVPATS